MEVPGKGNGVVALQDINVFVHDIDEDSNGHGTHCAGAIALRAHGVSKAANIIAVKILVSNGSRSMTDVVECVVWAASQAAPKATAARAEFATTGKTNHK